MSEPRLAESPTERLRRALLARYGDDTDFSAALEALYRDHCEMLPADLARREPNGLRDAIATHYGEALAEPSTRPAFSRMDISDIDHLTWQDPPYIQAVPSTTVRWAANYLAAIRGAAATFGLHRIDPRNDQRALSGGEALIHRWCAHRAEYEWVDPAYIRTMLYPWVGFLPPREQTVIIAWDPRTEEREAAQRRGYGQVRDALAAIEAGWRDAGLDRDRGREEARTLDWLYAKVRHGWSYQAIAQRWHPESQSDDAEREAARTMVQRAVIRMAELVGIDRTGW